MPRGRNKFTSHRKPELLFTESPIQTQNKALTPVRGVDNPVTAEVIPIDECPDTWVSPQFRRAPASCQRRSTRLKHRKTSGTRVRHLSCGKENSRRDIRTKKSNKLVSLKFLGNKTQPISIIEDVDITGALSPNPYVDITGALSPNPEKIRNKNVISRRKLLCESLRSCSVTGRLQLNTGECSVTIETFSGSDCDAFSEHYEVNFSHNSTLLEEARRIVKESEEESNDADGDGFDPGNNCPARKLFVGNLIQDEMASNQRLSMVGHLGQLIAESPRQPELSTFPRRSARLAERYQAVLQLIGTESPVCRPKAKVLAADTPELEYGLSVRQRQIGVRSTQR